MINFVGIKYGKVICFLLMKNQQGHQVEIPIPRETANLISAHLAKISDVGPLHVEREQEDDIVLYESE